MNVFWLGNSLPSGLTGIERIDALEQVSGEGLLFIEDKVRVRWEKIKGQRVYLVSDLPISNPLPEPVVGVIPRDSMVIQAIVTLFTEMRESYDLGDRLIRSLNDKELAIQEKQKAYMRDSNRYTAIIRNATDLIFTLGPKGEILISNETMNRHLDSGESLAGRLFADFVLDEDKASVPYMMMKGFHKGAPSKAEVRLHLARGTTGIFSLMSTPLMEEGRIYALSVIGRDITDIRAMQHRLFLQAQDLSLMINGLAHELRNPLTVIGAYMKRIEKKERSMSVETMSAALSGINSSIERIEDMISRIEQYESMVRLNVSYGETDIRALVERVMNDMPLPVEAVITGDDRLTVFSDAGHINGALRRILENALDTGTEKIVVDLKSCDGYALVSVRDYGPGVKEDIETIFAPFYSGDPRKIGLGLTEARIAMAKIGSFIEVVPQAGPGAVFTLKILMDRRSLLRGA